jgi:biopolymer transport protein TolR
MRFPESRIRSDINVTPLVDVCLVLLIIFMVVTPMLGQEDALALPETFAPLPMPEKPEQLVVSVRVGGAIYFKDRQVSEDELLQTLRSLREAGATRPVMVRGDRQVPYRHVRAVLQIVQQAGFERAGLITQREEL